MTEEFKNQMEEGYVMLKELPGRGICALQKFLFTVAIVWGINTTGYRGRWCYGSYMEAAVAFSEWDGNGDPPRNWIKYKGEGGERSPTDAAAPTSTKVH